MTSPQCTASAVLTAVVLGITSAPALAHAATAPAATAATVKASGIGLDRLQADLPITASVTLYGAPGTSVTNVAVTATGANGARADFPTVATVTFGATGAYTYVQARYLAAGSYTGGISFTDAGGIRRTLSNATASVWGVTGKKVAFPALGGTTNFPTTGQFAGADWVPGRTSAYPWPTSGRTSQVNPGDNKLDCIDGAWSRPATDGTFSAARVTSTLAASCYGQTGAWQSDLVTTRHSDLSGFQMKAGDSLTASVTIADVQGSWPALWSWTDNGNASAGPGHGEVDFFEAHPDTGRTLELTNWATTSTAKKYCYVPNAYTSGVPFRLRVDVTTAAVRYLVNDVQVCSLPGVPADWHAHLIASESVSAGQWHAAPSAAQTAVSGLKLTDLSVWR